MTDGRRRGRRRAADARARQRRMALAQAPETKLRTPSASRADGVPDHRCYWMPYSTLTVTCISTVPGSMGTAMPASIRFISFMMIGPLK